MTELYAEMTKLGLGLTELGAGVSMNSFVRAFLIP